MHAEHSPQAAYNLGFVLDELGDHEGARAAYQIAIDSGHPAQAPGAAYNLGVMLGDLDDSKGEEAAFLYAVGSGHPHFAPKAAYFLGICYENRDDIEAARAAYQVAADLGHAVAAEARMASGRPAWQTVTPQGGRVAGCSGGAVTEKSS